MKKILILGCTGSIGESAIKVIEKYPNKFKIIGLTANKSIKKLNSLLNKLNISDYGIASENMVYINGREFRNIDDVNSLLARELDYDIMINGLVGSLGFKPTMESIKRNKIIALANKETIVAYGEIIKQLLIKYINAKIYPIDSEHSAIWQLIDHKDIDTIENIIITASGGVLFNSSKTNITKKDILNHPIWNMGAKVTVDSSTMMNKGLEIIEAHYLFDIPVKNIKVLIHPQSIVHGIVNFKDGTSIAHMAVPDMILPIEYALFYPERPQICIVDKLDLSSIDKLTFHKVDFDKYRALKLAYECIDRGYSYPAVLSAANEIAVRRFLKGDIKFNDIVKIVEYVVNNHKIIKNISIESIENAEIQAKKIAMNVEV